MRVRGHAYRRGYCINKYCKELHSYCKCLKWQGSRVLKERANYQEYLRHLESVSKRKGARR